MTGASPQFRRIVLELHRSGYDPTTVQLAVELAELMHLDLFGRFIDDPGIVSLAGLPFAREFRVLECEWHVLDSEGVTRSRDLAIAAAQRLFAKAARTSTATCHFEIVHETAAGAARAGVRAEDILVVSQATGAAGRAAEPLPLAVDAAFRTAAGVLIVPGRIARRHGPVVAVVGGPDDPSVDVANALAIEAKEALLLLDLRSGVLSRAETGERATRTDDLLGLQRTPAATADAGAVTHLLGPTRERLIVVRRGVIDDAILSTIASRRGVPVLVLGSNGAGRPRSAASTRPLRAVGRT
ncbi:hypothetical protein QNA08_07485 [Chelatococcus sp. SYSU_G07232]|uniref:UspA domain-containing protein n=1 Tax=Chelatococcus albus TaxID=3047466 RepID=A0ABT7AFD6_9HYPH|nr:hypothetical protein [Chelatococcus sp. SYSU_G07232]MDJ1158075.1 hypothetical protein [Chelatococcus sp. SYSU_G07232]